MTAVSPDPMSTPADKAVFLSYASQDAETARKVAESLQAFGIEVWFDRSELRGGDTWDQKIRRQIRECALFVPVISAQTQRRLEGYFRREWKLAVDRTHDMADSQPFLLPVVIDAIGEVEANVPDKFREVQWVRLPDRLPTPEFVLQVTRLLERAEHRCESRGTNPSRPSSSTPRRVTRCGRAVSRAAGRTSLSCRMKLPARSRAACN